MTDEEKLQTAIAEAEGSARYILMNSANCPCFINKLVQPKRVALEIALIEKYKSRAWEKRRLIAKLCFDIRVRRDFLVYYLSKIGDSLKDWTSKD